MAQTCADTFKSLCGVDFQGMVTEGRTDCPGRLWGSGIVRQSPDLQALLASDFWEGKRSFWSLTNNTMGSLDLANLDTIGVPNVGSGCPPCREEGMKELMVRKFMRTDCWTADAFDATCNYTGRPVEDVVVERIRQWGLDLVERELLLQILGIYLHNKNANGGDLIFDADDLANATQIANPGFLFKDTVVCGLAKMGCKMGEFSGMLTTTEVETSLFKRDLIMTEETNCDDGNCITRQYFEGKQFFSTDLELKDPDTGQFITVLFKNGAFGYAEEDLGDMALGTDTEECGPNGMPVEEWIPRTCFALHPVGWSNCYDPSAHTLPDGNGVQVPMRNQAPSQLINPDNWCRSFDCKNVGLAFVVHSEKSPLAQVVVP